MKVAELLKSYGNGERNFRGSMLRGADFKGIDLSGADFSDSDIRGANFSGSLLTGTTFIRAKSGLQRRWITCVVAITYLLILLSTIFLFSFGIFASLAFGAEEGYEMFGISIPIVVIAFFAFTIRSGWSFVSVGCAVVLQIVAGILNSLPYLKTADDIFSFLALFSLLGSFSVVFAATGGFLFACAMATTLAATNIVMSIVLFVVEAFLLLNVSLFFAFNYGFEGAFYITVFSGAVIFANAYIGRRALKEDARDSLVRSVAISLLTIKGTRFRRAFLSKANFFEADLKSADFRDASIVHTNWHRARGLDYARLGKTALRDSRVRELLVTHRGNRKSYFGCDLRGANLSDADLTGATLTEADISQAILEGATLDAANLTRVRALGTSFRGASLTGACLESWNIDSTTQLKNVKCEYVYLLDSQQERRPSSKRNTFQPGEFTSLFEEILNTIDLIFQDGVDWQAFFRSFQELRNQYDGDELYIQAIEKKKDGAFVIRLECSSDTDKTLIEDRIRLLYREEIQFIEERYKERLNSYGYEIEGYKERIKDYRLQNSRLLDIVETMANKEYSSKYDLRNAQFAGGFAETVEGNQTGGDINNQVAERLSLPEAAAEIQRLLQQLESSNPTVTHAEQTAFLNAMIPPTRRMRFISALKSASSAAIDEIPYAPILKALVDGWQQPSA